jgi:predicted ribosomally synthesized peptide with SipW-like signal peptide
MKHKKLIIVIVVLVVMAIAASVAYAWWSDTASTSGNKVSTVGVDLETFGLPITAGGLVPMADPALEAVDAAYPSVSYFWVKNGGSIPLMCYGWLSDGDDPGNINPYVRIRIWLLGSSTPTPVSWWTGLDPNWVDTFQPAPGGPFVSYDGTLGALWPGKDPGINYLSTRYWNLPSGPWLDTPMGAGEYGVYRAAVWLDSTAPDFTQNKTVEFTINFTGMQQEAWDEAGYDLFPKY